MPNGLSSVWHRTPEAAAIIRRLPESEVARVKQLAIPVDYEVYQPLSDRAGKALDRLEQLRTDAVSAEIGYDFASTQEPYDDARCRAWCALYSAAPSVFEVLRDAFAERAVQKARAA
jgi:hypothetical protein